MACGFTWLHIMDSGFI